MCMFNTTIYYLYIDWVLVYNISFFLRYIFIEKKEMKTIVSLKNMEL
jgi:hypothetical protein